MTEAPISIRLDVPTIRVTLLGLAAAGIALAYGSPVPLMNPTLDDVAQVVLFAVYCLDVWLGARHGRLTMADRRPGVGEATWLLLALAGLLGPLVGLEQMWAIFEIAMIGLLLWNLWQLQVALSRRLHRPGILLPLSFLLLIFIGTLLLKLPLALAPGRTLSWVDSFFTMTSAVCVTGLIVRDTATDFSPFGQVLIGIFIQLGGLGILVFGSMLALLLGTRLSLREDLNLSAALNDQPLSRVRGLIRFIVVTTLVCELLGALAMLGLWHGPATWSQRLGWSLFHSVSAFCNAGFALMPDGLESYRYSALPHLVVAPLLVVGGLGFPVLENLWRMLRLRLGRRQYWRAAADEPATPSLAQRRMSLHTKVVLTTTAGLYLVGVLMLVVSQLIPLAAQRLNPTATANQPEPASLDLRTGAAVLADASFMSLTARTAGFNTMPLAEIRPAGQFGLMMLMMVGGSPGGTAGGTHTTTLALLLLSIVATVRRRQDAEAFGRRIADSLIRKAATLAACYLGLVCTVTLLLCLSEPFPFSKLLFEAISAVTVTGLTLGVTPELTSFGKVVIMAAMFLGRVGPLALLGALAFGNLPSRPYRYAREDVVVG